METPTAPRLMRSARRALGLTQLELARRVRCTESMIARIETGRAVPTPEIKAAIASEVKIATWEVAL